MKNKIISYIKNTFLNVVVLLLWFLVLYLTVIDTFLFMAGCSIWIILLLLFIIFVSGKLATLIYYRDGYEKDVVKVNLNEEEQEAKK